MEKHAVLTIGAVLEKLRHPHKGLSALPSKNCLTSYHLPAGAKPGPSFLLSSVLLVGWITQAQEWGCSCACLEQDTARGPAGARAGVSAKMLVAKACFLSSLSSGLLESHLQGSPLPVCATEPELPKEHLGEKSSVPSALTGRPGHQDRTAVSHGDSVFLLLSDSQGAHRTYREGPWLSAMLTGCPGTGWENGWLLGLIILATY